MTDPFVHPEEPTAAAAIEAIREEFDFLDDEDMRYEQLLALARRLPPFPAEWRDDAHKVPGCLSQVWMEASLQDGRLMLAGASDAFLVAGLVAILLRIYSGRTPQEIAALDPGFVEELGLAKMSSNRGNGVASMVRRIRGVAQAAAAPGVAQPA